MRHFSNVFTIVVATVAAAVVATLLMPSRAVAQAPGPPTAMLTGRVTDEREAPIVGAYISAQNLAKSAPGRGVTAAGGEYTVYALQPGHYDVTVVHPGFAQAVHHIVVLGSEVARLDVQLVAGSTPATTTQAAGRGAPREASKTPHHEHVVSAAEIERHRPRTTTQAVESAPQVGHSGSNPLLQKPVVSGLSSSDTLTLVDGQRLTTLRTNVSPSAVDVSNLESVEVVLGSHSSLYGSGAVGGLVNLVTKRPTRKDEYTLDVKLDGSVATNGMNRRGSANFFLSGPRVALQVGGTLFRQRDYEAGGEGISLAEVLEIGGLYARLGNSAANFAVFSLAPGAEVPNSSGHGFDAHVDAWVFASHKHSFRYQQLNNHARDIGDAFETPPFGTIEGSFGFRDLDRYSVKYEGDSLAPWLERVSAAFYRQNLSLEMRERGYLIVPGSSYNFVQTPTGMAAVLTGHASAFALGRVTTNQVDVVSHGVDVQATFVPHKDLLLTAGYSFLRESSDDTFATVALSPFAGPPTIAIVPDARATNNAAFLMGEYNKLKRLHLTGSVRTDRWTTEANLTTLPPGTGIPGVAPSERARSEATKVTAQVGAVFPLGRGFSPYARVARSFRESGLDERYRAFFTPSPFLSVKAVTTSTQLEPEDGLDVEGGLTVQRPGLFASVGIYRNRIENFLYSDLLPLNGGAIGPDTPIGGRPAVARRGGGSGQPAPTIPQPTVLLYGVHGSYSVSRALGEHGRLGSVTPYGFVSWERGTNQTPIAVQEAVIRAFYNRPDTPVRLEGSTDDVPQIGVLPFIGVFGVRYLDRMAKWSLAYNARRMSRMTRIDPLTFYAGLGVDYGTFASFAPFTVQSIRASYTHAGESYRAVISVGVENLTDRLFFEHFQTAPAPGRSLTVGLTLDLTNLLSR
jgi:outer membrane receptor protein involved in Fe transport